MKMNEQCRDIYCSLAGIAFIGAVAMQMAGCTAIGFQVGANYDFRNAGMRLLGNKELVSSPRGNYMHVTLTNGDTLSGVFAGRATLSVREYATRYAGELRTAAHLAGIPALGDTLWIQAPRIGSRTLVRKAAYDVDALYVYTIPGATLLSFEYTDIAFIRNIQGHQIETRKLQHQVQGRHVPVLSEVQLVTGEGMQKIPVFHVREARAWRKGKAGRITGLILGSAADCAVFFIVTAIADAITPDPYSRRH